MHKIMAGLHQDHKHIARVLGILGQQLELMSSGGDPDLFLMTDIASYFQHYPDLVHHPKENKVYEVYLKRSDEAADIVKSLLKEHNHLPAVTTEFHNMIEAVLNDVLFVNRDELQQRIQQFIDTQNEHMNREEDVLFPLIEKTLTDNDWEKLDKILGDKKDPLFDAQVDECYENLYRSIKNQ